MKLLYGSQNFGYDIEQSDKDWLEFVYPTWDDIIKNKMISYEKKNEDGSITKVKDIRLIPQMIKKANFNDLQFLYSQELHNCDDLKWFLDNRDKLIKANLNNLFSSNKGYIIDQLKENTLKSMVRALCFAILILKVFKEEIFELKVENLREIRSSSVMIDTSIILPSLDKYESYCKQCEKNESLFKEMNCEIERLLKIKLYKN